MKKWRVKIKLFCWIVVIIIGGGLLFWPFWRAGFPVTHDGENHLARFAQYYLAFRQGQIPPRLAISLQNGYGYPVFNYNYPLANILSLPLSFAHVPFEWEYKLIVLTFFVIEVIATYQWWRALFPAHQKLWLPLLAVLTAPYWWTALWYRGSIGEMLMFWWLPVVAWQIERLHARRFLALPSLALSLAAFFLVHNVMVLFVSPIVIAYACWRLWPRVEKTSASNIYQCFGRSNLAQGLLAAVLGLGLSLWFWLPAFFEKQWVILDGAGLNQEYQQHFVASRQILTANIHSGFSYAGQVDGLSFGLGLVFDLVLGVSVWLTWRSRQSFYYPRLGVTLTALTLFLLWWQTSSSQWLWSGLPLVNFIQFPWRLGLLTQWLLIVQMVNLTAGKSRGNYWWLGVILLQLLLMIRVWPQIFFERTREDYLFYSMSTTTSGENTPKTFVFDISREASREPQIASGSGRLTQIESLQTGQTQYRLECNDRCLMIEHAAYFPGLVTTIDRQVTKNVDDDVIQGRVGYWVPAGEHEIQTSWRENTTARLVGDGLSLLSLMGLIFVVGRQTKKTKK